ncbi:SpoIIE family protein phosphatase [Streptomyces sp. Isolate_219]|uniref:SpoIIE family protein phosphatase n=1 Tax=Streptomyces sp. Isolate_219 TaxID=2950110 RepID=UPI0021C7A524|nr:SpoIIE family protein phosphatase [Streptomyces sp. Isolate_219]MCR8575206.1 SpoIIE family protein phosphatase [Streptomyces sp. Isolate_219]
MTGGTGSGPVDDPVGRALLRAMQETGASAGGVYVLAADAPVLQLTVMSGVPAPFLAPWDRVALAAPIPVAVATREQRLVWVGGQQQMARDFPRTAVAVPYDFSLAAAPVSGPAGSRGALLLLWPAGHAPRLSAEERGAVEAACGRLAALLAKLPRPDGSGPAEAPRVRTPPPVRAVSPDEALAAADYLERLPGGCCALDLEGRITLVTKGATELLGEKGTRLIGSRPWEVLPWLRDPVFEDRYRAAVISRRPTSFTASRPPHHWLTFRLFPDARGLSVWISPSDKDYGPVEPAPAQGEVLPVRAGQIYHVLHLAAALTEAVGTQDVVGLVADQIVPAFGAQGMIMYVAEAGRLRTIGHRGYPAEAVAAFEGVALGAANSPAVHTLATGEPSFFTSPEEMERDYPGLPRLTGKAARAVLPLIVSGRPVGCCILSYTRPRTFSLEERQVLTSLAGLIAQALDRARLYDTKHQLAHDLQAGLLPHGLPTVPGFAVAARYLPSTRGMDIGGDFYDLIRLDEDSVAAVIGDVQGHNAAAAALMGQVRTAVRAYATAGAAPDEVLARTNRLLTDLDPGLFTSCLYVHIDLRTRRACLACAGHPPPLLRHPGRHTTVLHVPPGLLLGIDPAARYSTTELTLPPKSVLALYTDGLIETPGTDPDRSVADLAARLNDAPPLGPDRLADALLENRHGDADRQDDVALMLLAALPVGPIT